VPVARTDVVGAAVTALGRDGFVLIVGGTGTGKTTLARALAATVHHQPPVVIDDCSFETLRDQLPKTGPVIATCFAGDPGTGRVSPASVAGIRARLTELRKPETIIGVELDRLTDRARTTILFS
jgi:energy-coupling factor transporter ATP-binding protein EcfA2